MHRRVERVGNRIGQSDAFDQSTVSRWGHQVGARYFVTGKVFANDERQNDERRVQYTLCMQVLDAETGEEVTNDDIAKGYKVDTDTYIEVTKDELDDIALRVAIMTDERYIVRTGRYADAQSVHAPVWRSRYDGPYTGQLAAPRSERQDTDPSACASLSAAVLEIT